MEKYLEAEPADVRNWLKEGKQVVDLTNIKANTLKSFVLYQVKKFKSGIDVTLHAGNNGRPSIPGTKQAKIRSLALNKRHRGLRPVGARVGVSYNTVRNVLKKQGAKPLHRYKTQKINQSHMERRVNFSTWMLKNFKCVRSNTNLGFLVNTDFSAKIRIHPSRNSKNDIVWTMSRNEAGDVLESQEEKFSVGDMIWGGISWRGLVPARAPVFMSDF